MAMKIAGVEAKMNSAAKDIHKSGGVERPGPAAKRGGSEVGNETKADMAGAQNGRPTDSNPLSGAVKELHSQHPQRYDDLGPHHSSRR
jgi:hypothetical protein